MKTFEFVFVKEYDEMVVYKSIIEVLYHLPILPSIADENEGGGM